MKYNTIVKILWAVVLVAGACLSSIMPSASADSTITGSTPVTVNVTSSCLISSTVTSAHTATIANGVYQSDIGSTSIKTVCNDPYGYAIYAVGYDSSQDAEGVTSMHNVNRTDFIETGTGTSGADSAWAMKLSSVAGTYAPTISYASSYSEIPSTRKKVASYSSVVGSDEGSTMTTTYQAYVSPTQSAGVYTGEVKYTLVHPDNASGGLASITYLQEISSSICDASNPREIANLIDKRDGKSYNVAKLDDGYCWMVENLRYAGNTITESNPTGRASSDDTNLPTGEGGATTYFDIKTSTPTGAAYDLSSSWVGTNTASEYYPDNSKTGSQYYGYYYNWYAAVAGTVSGNVAQEAPGSICPKGWGLPVNSASVGSRSYSNLMFQSKVIGDITASGWISYSTGGFDILTSSPMNFLLAGNHNATGTGVSYRGSYGYYWSKSSYSTTNAYYLNFLSSRVVPRDYGYYTKAPGLTVRCVAL